jgi:integrase/recombinase XerD
MPDVSAIVSIADAALCAKEESDSSVVAMWLHGRGRHTARAYRADLQQFMQHTGKPLHEVTLGDVQTYATSLARLAPASQARRLASVKSLIKFACRIGYLRFDVALPLRLPAVNDALSERILDEGDVIKMIALEPNKRSHALLRLLYVAGLRISEVAALHWRDTRKRATAGQITVLGEGSKTRAILLPPQIWKELATLRGELPDDAPVFRSRQGGALGVSRVHRIVKAAARRAGLSAAVSAHWLRHCHVSHALDRGAPVHLVQSTVGHADLKTTGRYSHARPNDSSARYLAG